MKYKLLTTLSVISLLTSSAVSSLAGPVSFTRTSTSISTRSITPKIPAAPKWYYVIVDGQGLPDVYVPPSGSIVSAVVCLHANAGNPQFTGYRLQFDGKFPEPNPSHNLSGQQTVVRASLEGQLTQTGIAKLVSATPSNSTPHYLVVNQFNYVAPATIPNQAVGGVYGDSCFSVQSTI